MKKIYKTRLLIQQKKWIGIPSISKIDEDMYDEVYDYIKEDYKNYILKQHIVINGLDDSEFINIISDNNNNIKIPKEILFGDIYVTNTIFPNIVKEIITGKYFHIAGTVHTIKHLPYAVSSKRYLVEHELDYILLKNYLENANIIKTKIDLSFKKSLEIYNEKYKEINERITRLAKEKKEREAINKQLEIDAANDKKAKNKEIKELIKKSRNF